MIRKDIEDSNDIKILIDTFYEKVLADDIIGYIFTAVAKIDMTHHMPLLYSFWESVLFAKAGYKGNPMLVHIELNKKEPLLDIHFNQWIKLFTETVDELFEGELAAMAKQRAQGIRLLMQLKIQQAGTAIN